VSLIDFLGNLDDVFNLDARGVGLDGSAFKHIHGRSKDLLHASDVIAKTGVVFDPSNLSGMLQIGKAGASASMK